MILLQEFTWNDYKYKVVGKQGEDRLGLPFFKDSMKMWSKNDFYGCIMQE